MESQVEIIQINIAGKDQPGLTSSLTDILARYDAFILDIGQANIHQSLQYPSVAYAGNPDQDDLRQIGCHHEGAALQIFGAGHQHPLYAHQRGALHGMGGYAGQEPLVGMQGKNRYIITLLGRQLTARHIADVAGVISRQGLNIDAIKRMTGRVPLHEDERAPKSCIEFSVRGSLTEEATTAIQEQFMSFSNNGVDISFQRDDIFRRSRRLICFDMDSTLIETEVITTAIQEQFMSFSNNGVDISFQRDDIFRRSRRLICFDMDSTLIETEVIDELAERAGVGAQVRAITERAMRGEIDFRESFTERVALLKGLDVSVMEEIAQQLPITEGLERMMTILKRVGYKTAILSGGFTYFGNYLRQRFGFDYVYANELEIVDGRLTGRYAGEIVDGRRKAELLRLLCQFENINIAQSIAVGDGANDLPMLSLAGLGIAFHAKPKVKATAGQSISTIGLDGILYFLGLKDSWIER